MKRRASAATPSLFSPLQTVGGLPSTKRLRPKFRTYSNAATLGLIAQCLLVFASPASHAGEGISSPDIVKEIAECLHQRGEFVVYPKRCVSPLTPLAPSTLLIPPSTPPEINANLPFNISQDEIYGICHKNDPRALRGDIVKRIVDQAGSTIGPMGIRIIGGVYCDRLDLAGLDLQYSLILDSALFTSGILARNLRVKGDFSIDGGLVFGYLLLNRARIYGSFYHGSGFIWREIVTDTKIEGTWHQAGTVIFDQAQFQSVDLSGDLDLTDSALGILSVDSSQIREGLILNDSEARCRYEIKRSDIGFLLAERAGFGSGIRRLDDNEAENDTATVPAKSWWLKFWKGKKEDLTVGQRKAQGSLTSPAVRELIKATECFADDVLRNEAWARFAVLETQIRANMCLRDFGWLQWPSKEYKLEAHPKSALLFNGTNVGLGLIVTFREDKSDQASPAIRDTRSFEAKGVTAGSLVFEFSTHSAYVTELDGLKFGRIYGERTHGNLASCQFKSETAISGKPSTSGHSFRPVPPTVEDVAAWLQQNTAVNSSTQPFTAFAEAFESIGEDARSLRVARATQELWNRTYDWWKARPFPIGWSSTSFRATFIDSIPIAFHWILGTLVDHGYRPEKAIYGVLITLGVFWWIFWFQLKIVAFETTYGEEQKRTTTKRPKPLPIGFLFLFDRLIPAFEIRKENYSIGKVYRRVSPFFRSIPKKSKYL
jgi:hypothetical protein